MYASAATASIRVSTVNVGVDAATLTVGRDGAMWGLDAVNPSLVRVAPHGRIVRHHVPSNSDGMLSATDLVVAPDGNFWFADSTAGGSEGRIVRVSPRGVATVFPVNLARLRPAGGFEGLTVGPDGALWFTTFSGRVGRMTLDGRYRWVASLGRGGGGPIVAGPGRGLWIANSRVELVAVDGRVRMFKPPTSAAALAWGGDGNLWIGASDRDGKLVIGRFTPQGGYTRFPPPVVRDVSKLP